MFIFLQVSLGLNSEVQSPRKFTEGLGWELGVGKGMEFSPGTVFWHLPLFSGTTLGKLCLYQLSMPLNFRPHLYTQKTTLCLPWPSTIQGVAGGGGLQEDLWEDHGRICGKSVEEFMNLWKEHGWISAKLPSAIVSAAICRLVSGEPGKQLS